MLLARQQWCVSSQSHFTHASTPYLLYTREVDGDRARWSDTMCTAIHPKINISIVSGEVSAIRSTWNFVRFIRSTPAARRQPGLNRNPDCRRSTFLRPRGVCAVLIGAKQRRNGTWRCWTPAPNIGFLLLPEGEKRESLREPYRLCESHSQLINMSLFC